MVKKRIGFLFAFLLSLVSCSFNNTSDHNSNSSLINTYEKDEEGFFILEDNFFSSTNKEDEKKVSYLKIPQDIASKSYKNMRLYAGDQRVPIYNVKTNFSHVWSASAPQRMNNAVATIELKGKMTFKLQTNFLIKNTCTIRPLNANIPYLIDEARRVVTFTVSSPGQYTIEFRSDITLHLFVNDYNAYDIYKNDANTIYFGPGIHNKDNSTYIQSDNYIHLNSNTTIYLELGAIIEGGFNAYRAENIKIVGSGIIDGSVFARNAETNERFIPYDFSYCNNLSFLGTTNLDPAGWCYNLYFSNHIEIDRIKIISSRSNGDGVSLQSCQNTTVTNSFVRSWDDALVVKNYPEWSNMTSYGTTQNITFENCIIWTDLAQSMEIGYETYGKIMNDITFRNITVLHNYHKAVISIHNGNQAEIKRVTFENITIEDASMGKGDGLPYLIDFTTTFSPTWSLGHGKTSLGSIDEVYIKNVKVLNERTTMLLHFEGAIDTRSEYYGSLHEIQNIYLEDIEIVGETLDSSSQRIIQNEYVKNLNVSSVNIVTGSVFISCYDATLYGNQYIIEVAN